MQITIETSGGFAPLPRLREPITIDTETVAQPVADELRQLVEAAEFFEQPETASQPAPGAADLMTYLITVRDGAQVHTIRLTDPVADTDLQRLIERLQAIGRILEP